MINKFSKFVFFYLAYLPLFIILLVLNISISLNLLYWVIGIVFVCFLLFIPLIKSIKSLAPSKEEVEIVTNNNAEVLGFIFTYIFPFLITFTSLNSIIAFAILIVIVFVIYIDTSLFSVNPLLKVIFGYNIYEVSFKGRKFFLLSKNKYFNDKVTLKIKQLDSEVLIEDD